MTTRVTSFALTCFAIALLLLGLLLIFGPVEAAALVGGTQEQAIAFAVLGAALFGLGMLNWMTREAPIGGIYGRPVLIANLVHFVAGGLALVRYVLAHQVPRGLWGVTALYVAGIAFFGMLLFSAPKAKSVL